MTHSTDYAAFLHAKLPADPATGIPDIDPASLNPGLFPFQRAIVAWALRRGRAAVFADCGLGKAFMQLEWARHAARHLGGPTLILAPLAVAQQTVHEGEKFGIPVAYAKRPRDVPAGAGLVITNYERLDAFDPAQYPAVVLDESSILKAHDGATRQAITEGFARTPFRLACTATPAPNDFMELGTHAEFLSVMTRAEMLAMFFVHDGGEVQQWRLKGHAEDAFWRWLATWSMLLRMPSDLGFADTGYAHGSYILPPLLVVPHTVHTAASDGFLFPMHAETLAERLAARRDSLPERVAETAAVVNATPGAWVVWCHLNAESEALVRAIPGAVEVTGSMSADAKEAALLGFQRGAFRVLVTKPSVAGYGLNWQHCHQQAFVGLSDSWESYYQAVRRCWRFGQQHPVTVHVVAADTEGAVVANLQRKESDARRMAAAMVTHMAEQMRENLGGMVRETADYVRDMQSGDGWTLHLADCVDVVRETPEGAVDFSVFSPPFASLYTYTNSPRDMGNVTDQDAFAQHFGYLVPELLRVTKPGRLCAVHCMNLPTSKVRDGVIGIRDFRGDIIRAFEAAGWVYHSEVCIWKDPVTAMQRTKALGLLYKQLKKDSAMSRQGIPDYLVVFRKPGENLEPVTKDPESFPVSLWQRYASPVWMDINPSDTLQFRSAREHADERHICPLQLDVIRRAVRLWTNPGDVVFSPFAGIGSEGYVALEEGRRFLGAELKASYWRQACANLRAVTTGQPLPLFADECAADDAADVEAVA